jgi:hypothetical protein
MTNGDKGEYDCITPLQEREVFQRVQLGVPLKPARESSDIYYLVLLIILEKLRAISSPWVE